MQRLELALKPIGTKSEKRSSSWNLLSGKYTDSDTGVYVSPVAAENLSAAFASVQLIAQTIASLPLFIYRKDSNGARFEEPTHPVAKLFAGDVNENQTVADFFELMQAAVLWHGNAYAEVVRNERGQPVELVPHHPGMVSVWSLISTAGHVACSPRKCCTSEIAATTVTSASHACRGRGKPSVRQSPRSGSLPAPGTTAPQRRASSRIPKTLGPEAAEVLRQSLANLYGGLANAGKIGVLEEGMTWTALSVSPEDAQLLESRRFSVESVCRLFGVPPQLVGDTSKSAYA